VGQNIMKAGEKKWSKSRETCRDSAFDL